MARRRRRKANKRAMVASIDSLPRELVREVLARVAASSFTDFFNTKLSCKDFYESADDNYMYQRMSVKKFPVVPWLPLSEKACSFLNRCKESGNPEVLYRQGVIDYFSSERIESGQSGLESLKKAASSGHSGALYVLGIILVLSGDEFKQHGIQLLSGMKKSKATRRSLRNCRKNLRAILGRIWIRNHPLIQRQRPTCCAMRGDQHKRRTGWGSEEEDDIECLACQCDREVDFVCGMFPRIG